MGAGTHSENVDMVGGTLDSKPRRGANRGHIGPLLPTQRNSRLLLPPHSTLTHQSACMHPVTRNTAAKEKETEIT